MFFKTETKVGAFIVVALGIFFYISFYLGVFHWDRGHYNEYIVYFKDISGLEKKADVKIAGVKVGWVDRIILVDDNEYHAKAVVAVLKKYILRKDAHAIVRQDGILGAKHLDIVPGDPELPELQSHEAFCKPGKQPASVDDILRKIKEISTNVEDVSGSFQEMMGGPHGKQKLNDMFNNLHEASIKLANFSSCLDRTLSHNEATIEDVAREARDGLSHINSIATRIDEGNGLLGKLVTEDDVYCEFKSAVKGVNNYITKLDSLAIVFDTHGEFMMRHAEHMNFKNSKGYFDVRIHPNDDYFIVLQMLTDQKGRLYRTVLDRNLYDEHGNLILLGDLLESKIPIAGLVGHVETTERHTDQFKFSIQFGKMYKDLCLRIGLFEEWAGLGVDFNIPFGTDNLRWVTSLELFDLRGRNRIDDARPHVKWINRLFIMRNIYMTFGADDFISRQNANGFFGGGIRFCDEDIKYLAGKIGLASITV